MLPILSHSWYWDRSENLIHADTDYTRYKFFYINYLIEQNKFDKINEIVEQIDTLNSSLLISLTKIWVDKKNFEKFNKVFSCNNETDILSEYFFLIANLYNVNMINFPIIEYVLKKLVHPLYKNITIPDEMNLEFLYNIYPIVTEKFNYNNWLIYFSMFFIFKPFSIIFGSRSISLNSL